jgi:hypothetical protein
MGSLSFSSDISSLEEMIGFALHITSGHYATSRKVAGSSPGLGGFSDLPNPSSRTMSLGSTQLLTKISTTNLPGGKKRPGPRTTLQPSMSRMSENVGASTSRKPKGLHGLDRESFTLLTSLYQG